MFPNPPGTGWTDDLSITVAPEHTLDKLVEFVLESERRGSQRSQVLETLTTTFGLSFDDARLALDRVEGGQVRAEIAANEPDPVKDPVAHISYQRARGAPPPVARSAESEAWGRLLEKVGQGDLTEALAYATSQDFQRGSYPPESEAAELWRCAMSADPRGLQAASTSSAAVHVLGLAEAMRKAVVSANPRVLQNVLLQVGVAIASVMDSRIAELGSQPHALPGTPAWFDAIKLAEAARRLSGQFSSIGDSAHESAALRLRAQLVTRLIGHCYDRVGRVMLECAHCERRLGNVESAAALCQAVIGDFARLVEQCESDGEPLPDEHEIALRKLVEAIDLLREIRGGLDSEVERLRARCADLL